LHALRFVSEQQVTAADTLHSLLMDFGDSALDPSLARQCQFVIAWLRLAQQFQANRNDPAVCAAILTMARIGKTAIADFKDIAPFDEAVTLLRPWCTAASAAAAEPIRLSAAVSFMNFARSLLEHIHQVADYLLDANADTLKAAQIMTLVLPMIEVSKDFSASTLTTIDQVSAGSGQEVKDDGKMSVAQRQVKPFEFLQRWQTTIHMPMVFFNHNGHGISLVQFDSERPATKAFLQPLIELDPTFAQGVSMKAMADNEMARFEILCRVLGTIGKSADSATMAQLLKQEVSNIKASYPSFAV